MPIVSSTLIRPREGYCGGDGLGDGVVVGAGVVVAAGVVVGVGDGTGPETFGTWAAAGTAPASEKVVTTGTATAAPTAMRRRKTRRSSVPGSGLFSCSTMIPTSLVTQSYSLTTV
jgi:hypothetical protein